jgi:hypothetical protein
MLAGMLFAQEYRGRVQGVVSDSSRAVVPGARVTLHNAKTGVEAVKESGPNGHYLFDFVEPGVYLVRVEMEGFNKFVQENILVENRGDVTVNASLQLGAVAETISVTAAPVTVKFNTTSMEMTVDNQMVRELPIVARNPFTLVLLNPAVVNRYTTTRNPFFMWAASSVDVGGQTNRKNDVLVDGMPVMLGPKGSYAPPMEATTEVTVQQNSVDAEYGHSAGGILNVSMKSGTNDLHGTAYYFGRNPALNAVSNPLTHTPNLVRNHIWGASAGHAWVKNRIFNFASYEQWLQKDPRFTQRRMMTPLEAAGDFSQSRNIEGGLRTIYDPWTSRLVGTTATRQAFPNNTIPRSRMDPTALKFLNEMWGPNGPGTDITGFNNFQAGFTRNITYHNISNRTDFNLTDNLRSFFRFSRFRTTLEDPNWTPNNSRIFPNDNGGVMHSLNISGDVIYNLNPSTILNIRANYISLNDDYDAPAQYATLDNYREFFPGNDFYSRYLDIGAPFYFPGLSLAEGGGYGKASWWFQHPQQYFTAGKISKQAGKHNLRFGGEFRTLRIDAIRPRAFSFAFGAAETANTYINPNTRISGDPWASFLLGAMNPGSSWGATEPFKKDTVHYYAAFIQDDFKLNQNITLNLGLRYEYEGAIFDRGGTFGKSRFEPNRYSRPFDPANPIPEFQGAGAPVIPAEARALMERPYRFAGAWNFTDENNRNMWDPRKLILLPRAGIAVRLNDRTSLRIGWARYNAPSSLQRNADVLGSTPVPGFSVTTPVAPNLEGVPQQRLSDPFPVATNPVVMPVGKGDGRYTNLGAVAEWDKQKLVTAVNDRFNISLQRETVARILVETTVFLNFGRDLPYILDLNQVNPLITNAQGAALTRQVTNPFYQILPVEKFRGPLRTQRTVPLSQLLREYPHYQGVRQINTNGIRNRYRALQIRAQRPFANGFNFILAYNYNQEKTEEFFNKEEEFARQFRFEDGTTGRHRLTMGGTYEFPFGRGRKYLSGASGLVDAVLGGWMTSWIYTYYAGERLRFGQMDVVADPKIDNPDKWGFMFNPAAFRFNPNSQYQVRSNPKSYPGVQGPGYKNLDLTLNKYFRLNERFRIEFRMEAYNVSNTFTGANPNTNVTSAQFGRVTAQGNGTLGRELQYNIRLHF